MKTKEKTEAQILQISSEQQDKLNQLREEREKEALINQEDIKYRQSRKVEFAVNDPIFVVLEGISFSGYIEHVYGTYPFKYDVSTPHGSLTVTCNDKCYIRTRNVIDYSNVEVPEELKKMNTKGLLNMLTVSRTTGYYYWGTPQFSVDEIKAELSTREHIPNKKENRIALKYKKN